MKKKAGARALCIIVGGVISVIAFNISESFAASRSIARASVKNVSSIRSLKDSLHIPRAGQQAIAPARISADIVGLGVVEMEFVRKVVPSWPAYITGPTGLRIKDSQLENTVLLQGKVSVPGHRSDHLAAAGALIDGKFTAAFVVHEDRTRYSLEISELSSDIASAALDRSRLPDEPFVCAAHDVPSSVTDMAPASSAPVSAAALKTIEIATDADAEWYAAYGENSNSQIASFINEADTIYQNQLSLTFSIKSQNVFSSSSPYVKTDSVELLEEFKEYSNTQAHLGSADVYHLFTGVDLGGASDATIGIAYVGVVCRYPTFSYGLSENSPGKHAIVFAHEVGHNLNAPHDTTSSISIMYPVIPDSPPTSFSTSSKSTINSFVSNYGSCLSASSDGGSGSGDDGSSVSPSGVDLSAAFSQGTLTVNIDLAEPNPECTIRLRGSSKSGRVQSGTVLYEASGAESSYTLTGTTRVKIDDSYSSNKIYLAAQLVCPGTTGASYTKSFRVGRSKNGKAPGGVLRAIRGALELESVDPL